MTEAYKIINRESDQSVRLEFTGVFEGKEIVWHASIKSLYACLLEQQASAKSCMGVAKLHQFIDIKYCNNAYQVEIGLNLNQIDEPAIKRAIIMMRKYKRLHLGRHEYGEAIQFKIETD